MTKTDRFVDSFWEDDYIGTNGFDALCRQMKDGRSVCRAVADYFKERAKAEAQYTKALNGLFRNDDDKDVFGSLNHAWREVKIQTTKQAQIHEEARAKFQWLSENITKFAEDQKQQTKGLEDRVKKSQTSKKQLHNRSMDLQKTYIQKCRELDQAVDQLDQTKNAVTLTQKDVEKVRAKADRSKDNMEQSDAAYKNSLEHLEKTRSTWEADMKEACEGFQILEEKRIVYLREELWKGTNVDSHTAVECDKISEDIRLQLEICDPDTDITEFVERFRTGNNPPGKITYRSYYEDKSTENDRQQWRNGDSLTNRPPQPPPQSGSRPHALMPRGARHGYRHKPNYH